MSDGEMTLDEIANTLITELMEDELSPDDISEIGIIIFEKAQDEIDQRNEEREFSLAHWTPEGEH